MSLPILAEVWFHNIKKQTQFGFTTFAAANPGIEQGQLCARMVRFLPQGESITEIQVPFFQVGCGR